MVYNWGYHAKIFKWTKVVIQSNVQQMNIAINTERLKLI